jgi:DNA repair exonuclease SbcCD nuclease subunit
MAKVALLGDCHNGAGKSSTILQEHFAKFYDFFFDYLEKNNIKKIVQTGDFFDQRRDIHFTTIQKTNEYFFTPLKKLNIDLYIISGNHDCTFKNHNRINSVDLLCRDKATVVDLFPQTIVIDNTSIDLFPWINPENLVESIEFAKNSVSQYAVGHFEFANFPMYPGTLAEHGMDHKLFSNYDQVFSGHYHCISERDNCLYVGTPYELTWGDWSDPKGFWILDTEDGSKEYVRSPYTLFEKIFYVEGMEYDFAQVTDKYVKIIVVDKVDQKKFDKFVNSVNGAKPHDMKIIDHSIAEAVSIALGSSDVLVTTQSMIESVIDVMDTSLDRDKLKTHILTMYAEANQIINAL